MRFTANISKRLTAAAIGLVLIATASPAQATSSDSGDAGPNFNESAGCGIGITGPAPPRVPVSGYQTTSTRVYGPWADFYGRDFQQISASQAYVSVPMSGGATARVHARVVPAFQRLTANLAAAGRTYTISRVAGWTWRTVNGSYVLSQHAFGAAIDVNWATNPYRSDNVRITDMPAWFVQAWTDAGFCWGGDWVYIKDTMHYSWMGPPATPGYGARMGPYPPLTGTAAFQQRVLSVATPYGEVGEDGYVAMADRRRDGADDLYVVRPHNGVWRVEAAGAVVGFARSGIRRDAAAPVGAGQEVTLADYDGDGRADLWVFDKGGATVTATVYSDESHFTEVIGSFATGVVWAPGTELALGYLDWEDWIPDLFVVRRGAQTSAEVYSGSSGYASRVVADTTALGDTTDPSAWSFLLGDYNVDGVTDLYAVSLSTPAGVRVAIHSASTGYTGAATNLNTAIAARPDSRLAIGDYDGDGRDDIYVLTAGILDTYLGGVPDRPVGALTDWYTPQEPVHFDAGPECVGGGVCDQVGYVDGGGRWHIADEVGWGSDDVEFFFGIPGDSPFLGDWDGDGVETPGLYRRSDGYVYVRDSNTEGVADRSFFFGNPGDVPLVGDFDGDGRDTVSLYRPGEGRFYVINRLGERDTGLGVADFSFVFGNPGDKPFVGDFDGDGVDEVGLHRETTGRVYFRFSLTEGVADRDFIYGNPGDVLVAGDWDGDGVDTVAVYRPSDGNWYIKAANTQGVADYVVYFGDEDALVRPFAGRAGTSSR
jgi:hypothetical protein